MMPRTIRVTLCGSAFLILTGSLGVVSGGGETDDGLAVMRSELVVQANFGDADDEFGFSDVVTKPHQYQPVACFAVTSAHVYLFDGIKRDIKVYGIDGTFQKAIPARWRDTLPLLARDIAVVGDNIYLLVEFTIRPADDPEFAPYQLFTFNHDGNSVDRQYIAIPGLGKVDTPGIESSVHAVNTVRLLAGNDHVAVFDRRTQASHILVQGQKKTPRETWANPKPGSGVGNGHAVRFNEASGRVEIVTSDGSVVETIRERGYQRQRQLVASSGSRATVKSRGGIGSS